MAGAELSSIFLLNAPDRVGELAMTRSTSAVAVCLRVWVDRWRLLGYPSIRAAWPVVARHCPSKSERQCREIIQAWLKTGLLCVADYDDPIDRKARKGMRVDATIRPSV